MDAANASSHPTFANRTPLRIGATAFAVRDLDSEQQECINKAKALFRAAEEARRFASAAKRGQ